MDDDALRKAPLDRRALARELSRWANASVAQALAQWQRTPAADTRRIGVTGSPGSGKSTLISHLALCRRAARLGILAIDPSSPRNQGAILGDRIRMDAVIEDPDIYIRSLASRHAHDGLADNLGALLNVMERHGFDEVLLETVGVGQAEYAVRTQVDTLILVLAPNSGDAVQAMKSGLMEMPDLYVINKADLPGASKTATETRSILSFRESAGDAWRPRVIEVSASRPESVGELSAAIDEHQGWWAAHRDDAGTRCARMRHQLSELLTRRLAELADGRGETFFSGALPDLYRELTQELAEPLPAAQS